MRILFANKYNFRFSGTESYLFDVMDLLRKQGHEVALFAMNHGRPSESNQHEYLVPRIDFKSARGLHAVRLGAHAIYSCSARRALRNAIEDFRPDLAHVRNIYHHLSPSILWELRAQRIPVLYHVNDFKLMCASYNMVSNSRPCQQCCEGLLAPAYATLLWRLLPEGRILNA